MLSAGDLHAPTDRSLCTIHRAQQRCTGGEGCSKPRGREPQKQGRQQDRARDLQLSENLLRIMSNRPEGGKKKTHTHKTQKVPVPLSSASKILTKK